MKSLKQSKEELLAHIREVGPQTYGQLIDYADEHELWFGGESLMNVLISMIELKQIVFSTETGKFFL
jgi:hypothetical protein